MLLEVYINGELKWSTTWSEGVKANERCSEKLTPGTYNVEWKFTNSVSGVGLDAYIYELGVLNTPCIEVELLEPGSLGTEVLYYVDHLNDVHNLRIKGQMNNEDWAKIDMMTYLFSLDLSETSSTSIPNSQFYRGQKCQFLYEIKLPKNLKSIGESAFRSSYVKVVDFPSTLKELNANAFYSSKIQKAILPDSMDVIGDYAFYCCYYLTDVNYPKNLTYIPTGCFYGCSMLNDFSLHEGLTHIYTNALTNMSKFNARLPRTLSYIGAGAFAGCATDSLFIPEGVTFEIGGYSYSSIFHNSRNLVYAEFPTSFYSIDSYEIITDCPNLNTVVLKSPTVVEGDKKTSFLKGCTSEKLRIRVPSFIVTSYKLDEYWYNYSIEGFETSGVKNWTLNKELVLNSRERIGGEPNINIKQTATIKINGEKHQIFDSLDVNVDFTSTHVVAGQREFYYGEILVNNSSTNILGNYNLHQKNAAKTWSFVSLPFDFIVGDVTNSAKAQLAIRYYDGASRAVDGATGNWKNYTAKDTVKAGTGFIVQTSEATTLTFRALDNKSKQNVVSNEEFIKALEANPSESPSNSGWNLVGNPWQCYFNIHTLNFTAPITVYDVWNKTYVAYSIIDDDYAIRPNEAFFVQCPEGTEYISFPETGRQLTSEITNQSSAPAKRSVATNNRQLIDLAISGNDLSDKTRVVLNDAASLTYETACDASKFFALDAGVPQIYTLDSEDTEYAINERPVTDGNIQLGVMIAASGKHSISMQRSDAQTVVLIDHVAGTTHDLSLGEYTFTAEAGTYNGRFTLSVSKAPTTAIEAADAEVAAVKSSGNAIYVNGIEGNVAVFSVDGRKVAEAESEGNVVFDNMQQGSYLVRTVNGTSKVTVK